jgi:cell division protein FtsB
MKALKYLVPLWVSIVVYSALSLFSGAVGFSVYDQLLKEKEKQARNLVLLQEINRELEGEAEALLYDFDTITAYARELGYGKPEERFIRIVGLPGRRNQHHDPGKIVKAEIPDFMAESDIRFISLACGLGVLGCILAVELMRMKRNESRQF